MVVRQHILVSLVNDSISSSVLMKLVILFIHWSVQLSELMKTIYYTDLVYPAMLVSLNFWPDLEANGLMRQYGLG